MRVFLLLSVLGGLMLYNFVPWRIPKNGLRFAHAFNLNEKRYNLPNNLLARMAYQESRFRNDIITGDVKSSAGAIGLMQIIPRWHPDAEPYDPIKSIEYAAQFIRRLYNKFGTWPKALAAYNWGEGNLQKWINGEKEMPTETKNYINDILNDVTVV